MTQDILTILTIIGATVYCIFSFVKVIAHSKEKNATCSGCSGCTPKQHALKVLHKKTELR